MNVLRDLATRFLFPAPQQQHLVLEAIRCVCLHDTKHTVDSPVCDACVHTHTHTYDYEDDKKEEDKETIKELVHPRAVV